MATLIVDSKVSIERSEHIQALVDAGEMVAMTTITKRPSDTMCWMGTYYGGEWYPPSDPRSAEFEKLRYMLPAGEVQAPEWWDHDWLPEYRYSQVLAHTTWYKAPAIDLVKWSAPQKPQEARQRVLSTSEAHCRSLADSPRGWDEMKEREESWTAARLAAEARRGDVTPEALKLKPAPILPQLLQSNEDILEKIAMEKAPVPPEKVDELVEAVRYAVEHWSNEEARVLPDGYHLYISPHSVFIHLAHPDHPNHVIAGMVNPTTNKMEFESRRGEILDYMKKVAAGPRKLLHPALQSLNEVEA
jgi:hypothetical protein